MSEAGVDMERCMQGVDDEKARIQKITWTNCSEQMPPDDATQVLVRSASTGRLMYKVSGFNLRTYLNIKQYEWTEYTPEKWEALNK